MVINNYYDGVWISDCYYTKYDAMLYLQVVLESMANVDSLTNLGWISRSTCNDDSTLIRSQSRESRSR